MITLPTPDEDGVIRFDPGPFILAALLVGYVVGFLIARAV